MARRFVLTSMICALGTSLAGCSERNPLELTPTSIAVTSPTTGSSPTASTTSTANSTITTTSQPCPYTSPTVETFPYKTMPEVDSRLLSLDLHRPAGCGALPAIVWVHGGSWSSGDKYNQPMPVKATWAHANGWTLVSINYRLTTGPEPARWPDHGDDVADALAYVVNRSAELGVDASRLALIGHSAGGHLVSIVASDPEFTASRSLEDSTIDCVVSLDGVGYRLDDTTMVSRSVVASVFGSDRAVLESASPATQIERHGSPGSHFLVVSRGSDGNKSVAKDFVDLVNTKGGTAEFADVGDYGHNEVNALLGAPDETRLTPVVTDFLRRCLSGVG